MVLDGTWSYWVVWGGTGWYLVELGQYRGVRFGTCWYWVYTLYRAELDGTRSVSGR